jgi:hypothetical protein
MYVWGYKGWKKGTKGRRSEAGEGFLVDCRVLSRGGFGWGTM